MKHISLYVIDAYEDGEIVDCFYTTALDEAKEQEGSFLKDGLRVKWTAYSFTKDEVDAILYESICGKQVKGAKKC